MNNDQIIFKVSSSVKFWLILYFLFWSALCVPIVFKYGNPEMSVFKSILSYVFACLAWVCTLSLLLWVFSTKYRIIENGIKVESILNFYEANRKLRLFRSLEIPWESINKIEYDKAKNLDLKASFLEIPRLPGLGTIIIIHFGGNKIIIPKLDNSDTFIQMIAKYLDKKLFDNEAINYLNKINEKSFPQIIK